jgi:serine/threonine protein kinase
MRYCPNCGAQNTPVAKFCAQCGHNMTAAPVAGGNIPQQPQQPPLQSSGQPGALPPQTLLRGRYLILRLLGQGGMGAVYLASDRNAFDRRCVVKEMLAYYSSPTEKLKAEKDFEREARVLATLRFDGVPQVYEYFIETGKYYLVMEFVEGENLEDRMTRSGAHLPMDEALNFGLQLANTLVYLAKQTPQVIHRDIKPANIILDQDQNKVKLVDFGLAKESASTGLTGTLSAPLGTPGYAPMEQYTNQVEPRTDVYALGATLHHLLTGRDPRAEAPFTFPPLRTYLPGVKSELEDLVARMVATKVADRPSAVEVRNTLETMVHPQSSLAAGAKATPFAFRSGAVAYDASELALLCDQHWDDGIYHLYAGHLEAWLDSINRHDLAVRAESIRVRGGGQSAGLEEFLRAANPTIPLPSLAIDTRTISLGQIEKGSNASARIQIKNVGRGCLYGRVVPKVSWVTVKPQDFSLMPNEIADLGIAVNTGAFAEGEFDEPVVEITSNGGQEVVGCQLQVTWQPTLVMEPKRRMNLGEVLQDQLQPVTAPLVLRNTGGGVLQGRLATDAPWLSFDAADFVIPSGGSVTINVTALPADGSLQMSSGIIRIELPGTVQEITATVGVRRPWFDRSTRTRTWAIYGALIVLGYAGQIVPLTLLALYLMGSRIDGWMPWVGATLLFGASFAALVFSRRYVTRLDEMESYYFGQNLAASLMISRFDVRKFLILIGVGIVFGSVAGWCFAEAVSAPFWLWILAGSAIGATAGALLGAVGAPSPGLPQKWPWLARFWRGATLDTSPTFAAIRCGGLVLMGALIGGLLSGSWLGAPGASATLLGATCGLLLSTESHHILANRLRWILDHIRISVLVGLGAYLAITWLVLLRFGTALNLLPNYGSLTLAFPGLYPVLWQFTLVVAGWGGALAGLWVADDLKLPRQLARRLFVGLASLLLLASFPVFLFSALLLNAFLPDEIANALVFVLTAVTLGLSVWAIFVQRSQVESATARARQALATGVTQSRTLTQSAQGQLQKQLQTAGTMQPPSWLQRIGRRISGWLGKIKLPSAVATQVSNFSMPSLAEIETTAPLSLAFAAAAAALVLQVLIARLVVEIAVGLGIVFVVALLGITLMIGVRFAVLYLRRRRP